MPSFHRSRREARSPSCCGNRRSSSDHRRSRKTRLCCTEDKAHHRRGGKGAEKRAAGHHPDRGFGKGTGGDPARSCRFLVRRSPRENKTPIAIAALDEARIFVNAQVNARMTEHRRHFAGTVAGDLQCRNADDFRRRLGWHKREVATQLRRFNLARLVALGLRSYATCKMDQPAIRIESLSKTYAGSKGATPKRALDDVSFDVPRGEIFGLLGPNGAGKSTLINILAGLVMKTSGKVTIWGFDIDVHPRNSKRSIGVVPQEIIFDPFFTPRETLEIQAGLYGISPSERHSDELLAAMHLTDKANAYSRTLSGGMKRRLLVAKAMVNSPPILVLDEPTAGVDVELRRQL